ncbi:hypothetical protein KKH27_02390 [bacterium]|nr:hypothetical protein [bacterium]MBU1984662.1 hypothetical protein [bacterium]
MYYRLTRALLMVIGISLILIASGCQSRPAAANKLFEKGEYQAVVDKYPDLEIARRARAKIAEGLLREERFEEILRNYSDTPAAHKATEQMAQLLFARGEYQAILDSFPFSAVAPLAGNRLADSLFAAGQLDELVRRFPENENAKQIKEERGMAELTQAKKLKGDAKKDALTHIVRSYAGTVAQREANKMLTDIRAAEAPKRKK